MQFAITKEAADAMVKELLNMKQAIAVIESVLPGAEITKQGSNFLIIAFKGDRIVVSKEVEKVIINGRGGEAFRDRHLGFSQEKMVKLIDRRAASITERVIANEEAAKRNQKRREAMGAQKINENNS